jgi:hypothetical protein
MAQMEKYAQALGAPTGSSKCRETCSIMCLHWYKLREWGARAVLAWPMVEWATFFGPHTCTIPASLEEAQHSCKGLKQQKLDERLKEDLHDGWNSSVHWTLVLAVVHSTHRPTEWCLMKVYILWQLHDQNNLQSSVCRHLPELRLGKQVAS